MKPRLVLASASPRRKALLARLGYPFEVIAAEIEEWEAADAPPRELVQHNARLKAEAVAAREPGAFVLGSDTTVALGSRVLNKPADATEAAEMLQWLSGQTHTVYSAVFWHRPEGSPCAEVGISEVTFKELTPDTIQRYHEIVDPLDKAGGYGIQEGRELIIEGYTGCLETIMGLPLEIVGRWMEQDGLLPARTS